MRIAGREVERVDEAAERIEFLGVRALDPGADASLERRLLVELPLEMQRGKQPSIAIFRGSGFSNLPGLPMLGFDAQARLGGELAERTFINRIGRGDRPVEAKQLGELRLRNCGGSAVGPNPPRSSNRSSSIWRSAPAWSEAPSARGEVRSAFASNR